VIALRAQRRWFAMIATLASVLLIRPGLARPGTLLRRVRYVVGRPPPRTVP
jgi:hypothetical protein